MQPQRQTNPWMIVLGVCGGCALLCVIGGVIFFISIRGTISGMTGIIQNMPKFLSSLKSHDYQGAAALVDPAAQATLTPEKIQAMEEEVEKTLGPMQSIPQQPSGQSTTTNPGAGKQKPSDIIYKYTIPYQKGTATATFTFHIEDPLHISGKINDFHIEPNSGG